MGKAWYMQRLLLIAYCLLLIAYCTVRQVVMLCKQTCTSCHGGRVARWWEEKENICRTRRSWQCQTDTGMAAIHPAFPA